MSRAQTENKPIPLRLGESGLLSELENKSDAPRRQKIDSRHLSGILSEQYGARSHGSIWGRDGGNLTALVAHGVSTLAMPSTVPERPGDRGRPDFYV